MTRGPSINYAQAASLKKLKCSRCKKYLSVFPICKNPQGEAICGRCPQDANWVRDTLYEHGVEFQKFPCSYKTQGCLEHFTPFKLAIHEQKCRYLPYNCPTRVYNNCSWQGTVDQMLKHFQKEHPAFVLNEHRFEVDFINNHKENYLFPYEKNIFTVTRECDSSKNLYRVFLKTLRFMNADSYEYELTLENGNGKFKYHTLSNLNSAIELERLEVMKKLQNPPTITAAIKIKQKPQKIVVPDAIVEEDDEQLKLIECPICFKFMVPPIYQCTKGHSICKRCILDQSTCPMRCGSGYEKTQNYALEAFIRNLNYPCQYRDEGCTFKSVPSLIESHENSCLFGPIKCPLKNFEDCTKLFKYDDMQKHLNEFHPESLLEINTINFPFVIDEMEEDYQEAFILSYDQTFFRLCFKFIKTDEEFVWSVQYLGSENDCSKYNFELEIIDNVTKKKRIYIKSDCVALNVDKDAFDWASSISLYYTQVEKLMKNCLTYRINITTNV